MPPSPGRSLRAQCDRRVTVQIFIFSNVLLSLCKQTPSPLCCLRQLNPSGRFPCLWFRNVHVTLLPHGYQDELRKLVGGTTRSLKFDPVLLQTKQRRLQHTRCRALESCSEDADLVSRIPQDHIYYESPLMLAPITSFLHSSFLNLLLVGKCVSHTQCSYSMSYLHILLVF